MNLSNQKSFNILTMVFFAFLFVGCSGKALGPQDQAAKKDSANASDSASMNNPVKSSLSMTYEQRQGKFLYEKYCSICHGVEGKGDGFNAFNLDPKPRDFTDKKYLEALTDVQMFETMAGGGRAVNKSSVMPSWGGRLSKGDIEYLVAYVRTFAE